MKGKNHAIHISLPFDTQNRSNQHFAVLFALTACATTTPLPPAQVDSSTAIERGVGGIVAETVQVTATVTAIDQTSRKATLRFEDGSVKTLPVRDDIDLSQHAVGEKVVFVVTEIVALSVEKP